MFDLGHCEMLKMEEKKVENCWGSNQKEERAESIPYLLGPKPWGPSDCSNPYKAASKQVQIMINWSLQNVHIIPLYKSGRLSPTDHSHLIRNPQRRSFSSFKRLLERCDSKRVAVIRDLCAQCSREQKPSKWSHNQSQEHWSLSLTLKWL